MGRESKINITLKRREALRRLASFVIAGGLLAGISLPAAASYIPFNTSVNMNVGIGTSTPQGALVVTNGNVGIGTWAPGEALIVQGGNVGIGTPLGSQKLSVAGGYLGLGYGYGLMMKDSGGTDRTMFYTNGINNVLTIENNSLGSGGNIYLQTNSVATQGIAIQNGGNVGIGTTNPQGGFVVTNGNVGIGTWAPAAALDVEAGGNSYLGGNVGISSTAPGTALDVQGMVRTTGFTLNNAPVAGDILMTNGVGVGTWIPASAVASGSGVASNYWSLNGGAGNVGINTSYAVGIGTTFVGGTGEAAFSVMKGNVGIGTWVPAGKFQVGGSSATSFLIDANGNVGMGTTQTSSNALTIMNGNVGIGTWATPYFGSSANLVIEGSTGGSADLFLAEEVGGPFVHINSEATLEAVDSTFSEISPFGNDETIVFDTGLTGPSINTSGDEAFIELSPTYNETSGTTSNTDLLINRIETALGSGNQYFLDLQATGVDKFVINNKGNVGIGTSNPFGGNLIVKGGGNVGIGSLVPGQILDVQGTIRTTGFTLNLNPVAGDILVGNGVGVGTWMAASSTGAGGTPPGGSPTQLQYNNSGAFGGIVNSNVTASGNVGLGTGFSANKLDIQGSVGIGTAYAGYFTAPANGLIVQGNVGIGTWAPAGALEIEGGNVGIGTWNVSAKLFVNGTSEIVSSDNNIPTGLTIYSNNLTQHANYGSAGVETFDSIADYYMYLGEGLEIYTLGNITTPSVQVTGSGNVGIGTWVPGQLLSVASSGGNSAYFAGNVGIGSLVPGQKLDVQGTIRTTGFTLTGNGAASGNVLVTNGVGVGTWMASSTISTGGSPGGAPTQLQYNNSGAFGGIVNSNVTASGNVGLGTGFSANKLDIQGSVGIGTAYAGYVSAPANGLIVQGNVGVGSAAPGAAVDVQGNIRVNNGTAFNVFTTNVGIGSVSPGASLDVQGMLRTTTFALNNSPVAGDILMTNGVGVGTWIPASSVAGAAPTNYWSLTAAAGNVGISTTNSVGIGTTFAGVGTGLVVMNGNVGIGTWVPAGSLDIKTGNPTIIENGNVGIGSDKTPDATLEVTQIAGAPPFQVSSTLTTNGDYLIVANGGNVGIGSVSPGQLLDVQGTVRMTGLTLTGNGAASGNVLVTNGVGVGTWMSPGTLGATGGSASNYWLLNGGAGNIGINTTNAVGIGTSFVGGAGEAALSVMNGNVGIGTWVPGAQLDVEGSLSTVIFNGNVGIGTKVPIAGLNIATNGAASAPAVLLNGTWFTGGTAITNKPQLLVEPSGTTSASWDTSGTGVGINAPSGFSGNLLDIQLNGTSLVSVNQFGWINAGNLLVSESVNSSSLESSTAYVTSAIDRISMDNNGTTVTATNGIDYLLDMNDTFAPTSGNAIENTLAVMPIINQTGGANGITRGILVNPTLTAATDFRAIETSVGNVGIGTVSGNLGIGSQWPGQRLDVQGTARMTGFTLTGNGAASGNVLVTNGVGVGTWMAASTLGATGGSGSNYWLNDTGNVGINTTYNIGVGTIAAVNSVNILGNIGVGTISYSNYLKTAAPSGGAIFEGNVGIGTTSPQYPLQIFSPTAVSGIGVAITGIDPQTYSQMAFLGNGKSFYVGVANNAESFFGIPNKFYIYDLNANKMRFIIDTSGNIGIGTLVPGQSLDVQGTVRMTGLTLTGNGASSENILVTNAVGVGTWMPASTLATTAGSNYWSLNGGVGNVGINTTYAVGIGTTFVGGTGEAALSVMNGNVGIGTWVPRDSLDIVKGNIGIGTAYNLIAIDGSASTLLTLRTDITSIYAGYQAGAASTAPAGGAFNVALGYQALNENTTGIANSSVGEQSLANTTNGINNTAMGFAALSPLGNTGTSSDNTAFGYQAGGHIKDTTTLTLANQSTFLGDYTEGLTNGDTNETVIGYNAVGNGSNTVTLGNASVVSTILAGNVGIGTAVPSGLLEVGNRKFDVLSTGNVGIGSLTPGTALDVQGTVRAEGFLTSLVPGATASFTAVNAGGNHLFSAIQIGNSTSDVNVGFAVGDQFSSNALQIPAFFVASTDVSYADANAEQLFLIIGAVAGSVPSSALFSTVQSDALSGTNGLPIVFSTQNNDTPALYISNAATENIGIGTVVPSGLFEVGNRKFDVLSGGNVGIGSIAPGQLLDVQGTVRTTGFTLTGNGAASGNVLVTNGIGVGTWMSTLTLPIATVTAETPGDVTYYNTTNGFAGGTGFQTNGTNVGIGTSSFTNASLQIIGNIGIGTVKNGDKFITTPSPNGGMIVEGNVGIGTWVPTTPLSVAGGAPGNAGFGLGGSDVVTSVFSSAPAAGGATTLVLNNSIGPGNKGNQISFNSNATSDWTIGNDLNANGSQNFFIDDDIAGVRVLIDANGNVGIGSAAPGQLLDVNGTVRLINGGNLFLTAAGNIGIGTTAPQGPVDVETGVTTNSTGINLEGSINNFLQYNIENTLTNTCAQSGYSATEDIGTATTGFAWVGINNSTFNCPQTFNVGGAGDTEWLSLANNMDIANGASGKNIYFFTDGTANSNIRMTLATGGNVGIGTLTASYNLLSVAGGVGIGTIYAGNYAGPANALIVQGNVGIGTWGPQKPFSVTGDAYHNGNIGIGTTFVGGTGEGAVSVMNGNVGIGTWVPAYNLDLVNGTARMRPVRRIVSFPETTTATVTINSNITDVAEISGYNNAAGITLTIANPNPSTPNDEDLLEVRVKDGGTAITIAYGANFVSTTTTLPLTTVASTWLRILFEYNSATSDWECVAST